MGSSQSSEFSCKIYMKKDTRLIVWLYDCVFFICVKIFLRLIPRVDLYAGHYGIVYLNTIVLETLMRNGCLKLTIKHKGSSIKCVRPKSAILIPRPLPLFAFYIGKYDLLIRSVRFSVDPPPQHIYHLLEMRKWV